MAERRTWLWVVLGIVALCIVAFITFVALVGTMVSRNAKVTPAARSEATRAFDEVRSQFKDEKPLLTVDGDSVDDAELRRRSGSDGPRRAQSLHAFVFDPKDQKLLRLQVPLWLLRFSSQGNFRIGSSGLSFERVHLDPGALERIGPALLLDAQLDDADVLLWTE